LSFDIHVLHPVWAKLIFRQKQWLQRAIVNFMRQKISERDKWESDLLSTACIVLSTVQMLLQGVIPFPGSLREARQTNFEKAVPPRDVCSDDGEPDE